MTAKAQGAGDPLPTGDLRGDLKTFRSQVFEADRSYSPAARAAARARLGALEKRVAGIDALHFQIELCRILALADNGHTACPWSLAAPDVGLGLYPLDGAIYVFSAPVQDADVVGGRLLAVDGRPIETVRGQVRTLAGGRPGWRDLSTSYVYGRPAILQALGVARDAGGALYRIRTADGRVIERRLAASAQPPAGPFKRIMTPEQTPWIWRDMADPFRWRDAPEHDAIVVQLRSNEDLPGRTLAGFLDEVERQRAAAGRRTVILDMRSNQGGDFTLSREFLAAWPSRIGPGARFLVLLGPRTFSAGLVDIAYLKQTGGAQVTILGQPPGDNMSFMAEGPMLRLPGSGLRVRYATQRDDLRDGCRPYADCFAGLAQPGGPSGTPPERQTGLKRMPVSVASLEPDIRAPIGIDDYLAGHDPGLAKALDLARPCASTAGRSAACRGEALDLAGPTGGGA